MSRNASEAFEGAPVRALRLKCAADVIPFLGRTLMVKNSIPKG